MPSRAAYDAVQTRAAQWTRATILPFGVAAQPPVDGTAFLQIQFPVSGGSHVGMAAVGNRTFRETGVVRFVLSWPRGSAIETALDWMDELRALFRAAELGSLRTWTPSAPLLNDDSEDGQYVLLSFVVEFYLDTFA
jgi:hypothetical protein